MLTRHQNHIPQIYSADYTLNLINYYLRLAFQKLLIANPLFPKALVLLIYLKLVPKVFNQKSPARCYADHPYISLIQFTVNFFIQAFVAGRYSLRRCLVQKPLFSAIDRLA